MNKKQAMALQDGDILLKDGNQVLIDSVASDNDGIAFNFDEENEYGRSEYTNIDFDDEDEMERWEVVTISGEMKEAQEQFKKLISDAEALIKEANKVSEQASIGREAVLLSDPSDLVAWHSSRC